MRGFGVSDVVLEGHEAGDPVVGVCCLGNVTGFGEDLYPRGWNEDGQFRDDGGEQRRAFRAVGEQDRLGGLSQGHRVDRESFGVSGFVEIGGRVMHEHGPERLGQLRP